MTKNNLHKILIRGKEMDVVVDFSDIIYIESESHTVIIHTLDKCLVSYMSLRYFETILVDFFIRCHNRYLVNIMYIYSITDSYICLSKFRRMYIPVSVRKRNEIDSQINEKRKHFEKLKRDRTSINKCKLKSQNENVRSLKSVQYLESCNKYVLVHWYDGNSTILKSSMQMMEEKLRNLYFVRTHRGIIVNICCITTINANDITLASGQNIPMAKARKSLVIEKVAKYVYGVF